MGWALLLAGGGKAAGMNFIPKMLRVTCACSGEGELYSPSV